MGDLHPRVSACARGGQISSDPKVAGVPEVRRFLAFSALLALAACGGQEGVEAPAGRTRVVFEGVQSISTSELQELVASDVGRFESDQRPSALDDAAYRVEYRYRQDGFDRVQVNTRTAGDRVIFRIQEGPRIFLGKIRFLGATLYSPEELEKLIPDRFLAGSMPYSLRIVLLIEESLYTAYRSRGYIDVSILRSVSPEPDKNGRLDVSYTVDEGKPYLVTEIRGLPSDKGLEEKTAPFLGHPYAPATGEALEATILDYYREHGHPLATARAKPQIDHDTGSVGLDLEVSEGPKVKFGEEKVEGAVWTRTSFIQSRTGIKEGDEYKVSELHTAEERLIATNAFKKVRVIPEPYQEESGTQALKIEVEEREVGQLSVSGGYGSFEKIRLGSDLTGVNIWGGGETLRVGGNFSKVGYRAESELGVPYLFGSELRLGVSGYYESEQYPSFDALSRGGVLSLTYPLFTGMTATLGVRHANIITSNVSPDVPPGDLLDFNYTAFLISPTLDLRDNPLLPTRGILLTSEVSYSPSDKISDVEFWSASGRFSYYFPFPAGIVFATSFQGGVIAPIGGTQDIPIALREFAGGTNSVRGYKFQGVGPKVNGQPTGGEVFLALQSEVRFPIWGEVQGALFTDQGGVWADRTQVNLTEIRYSVGTGIRYITAAGALAADIGVNPHPRQGEYYVEFALSVGFPF